MSSHVDLEKLCEMAKSKGASGAAVMASRGVVMDPRVRLKCMVPRCANFGHNLMCPPNVMSMEEFSKVLRKYLHTIVIQYPLPLDEAFMEGAEGKRLEDIYEKGEYQKRMAESERAFTNLLGDLESEALRMGYRFATALTGGACKLCDECVGQGSGERCRHPFRSRPSMEAMGIDVYLTAKNAGLPFDIPPKDHAVWNGLLLIG
jgi:predicted metal-binding protein